MSKFYFLSFCHFITPTVDSFMNDGKKRKREKESEKKREAERENNRNVAKILSQMHRK